MTPLTKADHNECRLKVQNPHSKYYSLMLSNDSRNGNDNDENLMQNIKELFMIFISKI